MVFVCVCTAYRALYDYNSSDARDLSFTAGEVITVSEMNGSWWVGSIGNRSGMFPANYVTAAAALDSRPPINTRVVCCYSNPVSVF